MKVLKLLKEKYIKNKNFYHLYRYFKYKARFFPSYSATGEDVFINKIFENENHGFFVDVGALHPINGSLTYNLYKKGWSGLNIDLMEQNLLLFKYFRKRDKNINLAISSDEGDIKAYIFERGSGLNTTNKKWAEKWKKKIKKSFKIHKVKKNTLSNVLSNEKIKSDFELLNIDVEGHELEVIQGLDLKKYRPKLITIEIHCTDVGEILKTKIYKILTNNRYKFISHHYQTSFFISNDYNFYK